MPIVVLPKPTPANVVVLALPDRLRFLIVLLVVGSAVPTVWPQMTALEVPVLVLRERHVAARAAGVGAVDRHVVDAVEHDQRRWPSSR